MKFGSKSLGQEQLLADLFWTAHDLKTLFYFTEISLSHSPSEGRGLVGTIGRNSMCIGTSAYHAFSWMLTYQGLDYITLPVPGRI